MMRRGERGQSGSRRDRKVRIQVTNAQVAHIQIARSQIANAQVANLKESPMIRLPNSVRAAAFLSLATALGGATASPSVQADSRCREVHGTVRTTETTGNCASPLGLCTAGRVTGAGLLDGATTFLTLAGAPSAGMPGIEPAANLSYSGQFTLTTRDGVLESSDLGALDASHALFIEMYRPVSGTGQFADWSGDLFSTGHIVDNGTSFEGEIHGTLCTPHHDY